MLFRRLFLDIDSATRITEPSLSSLSVLQRFREACFLCFLSEEQNHREKLAKQRHCGNTEQSSVLVCVVFEKSEMLSSSGSVMGVVSPSTEVTLSSCLGS